MGTAVVLAILLVLAAGAVLSSAKHFKGEGGCCGGSAGVKVKRWRLGHAVATKKLFIEGMHCENCRQKVENALNSLDQVSARVSLRKKAAIVKLGAELPEEVLVAAVESLGYRVTEIR